MPVPPTPSPAVAAPAGTVQSWPAADWPRTTPEAAGLDAASLAALDADFAAGRIPLVDDFLVVRSGAIAYERHYAHDYGAIYRNEALERGPLNAGAAGPYNYFDPAWHPYVGGTAAHTMQSVSKSVTSATIGVAIARGDFTASLDTPVLHWFDAAGIQHLDPRKRRLALRHVLTMTTGLEWHEDLPYDDPRNSCCLMEAAEDWVQFAIDRPMAHEPGTTFTYSSGATELLAYIFRKETGQDIEHYAVAHLFGPLGITHHHWKRTPLGEVDTEGGLYLSCGDLARIGYLYLRNGVWNGAPLLRPDWIRESLTPHVDAGAGWRYGFQWWLVPYGDGPHFAWAALGIGGQHLFVFPEDDLVVVVTAWHILEGTRYAEPLLRALRPAVRTLRRESTGR